jgi:hypothetical protein
VFGGRGGGLAITVGIHKRTFGHVFPFFRRFLGANGRDGKTAQGNSND